MSDTDHELVLAFDSDDTEFVRGVEVGVIHHTLTTDPLPLEAIVHASNAEMLLRLAEAHGRHLTAEDHGDWLRCTFSEVTPWG